MAVFTALAIGAAVVGGAMAIKGQRDARRAARRSAAAQQKQQDVASRRQRRQAIREAQIARAQTVASAQASGATGSSAALGGAGSLGSQLGTEMGYSTQMSGLSRDISRFEQQRASAQNRAQIGGTLFSAGWQGIGGFQGLSDMFSKPNQAQTPNPRYGN